MVGRAHFLAVDAVAERSDEGFGWWTSVPYLPGRPGLAGCEGELTGRSISDSTAHAASVERHGRCSDWFVRYIDRE